MFRFGFLQKKAMSSRECGRRGEEAAAKWLKAQGFTILARNLHLSHQELDIIAENDDYLIFVEVKTHGNRPEEDSSFGSPARAVTPEKQKNTLLAARRYLRRFPTQKQPRIDVIEVWLGGRKPILHHIPNAIVNS